VHTRERNVLGHRAGGHLHHLTMTGLYLFSLILGAGLLLVSLFGGDAEVEADFDLDLDAGGGLDAVDAGVETDVAAFKVLSIRGLIYAAFGFGAGGFLAEMIGAGTIPSLATAVAGGVLSGTVVTAVFEYLRRTNSGDLPGEASLRGRSGRVTLPIGVASPGRIVVERGGREVTLRALPHSTADGDPETWSRVLIVEVENGVARVTPDGSEMLLE
jgi:hypothetical protein